MNRTRRGRDHVHRRLAVPRSVHVVRVEMASAPELNTYYDHFIGSKGIVTRETPGGVLTWPLHKEQRPGGIPLYPPGLPDRQETSDGLFIGPKELSLSRRRYTWLTDERVLVRWLHASANRWCVSNPRFGCYVTNIRESLGSKRHQPIT